MNTTQHGAWGGGRGSIVQRMSDVSRGRGGGGRRRHPVQPLLPLAVLSGVLIVYCVTSWGGLKLLPTHNTMCTISTPGQHSQRGGVVHGVAGRGRVQQRHASRRKHHRQQFSPTINTIIGLTACTVRAFCCGVCSREVHILHITIPFHLCTPKPPPFPLPPPTAPPALHLPPPPSLHSAHLVVSNVVQLLHLACDDVDWTT